jgi:c-di-GMP-related signal transduction protein
MVSNSILGQTLFASRRPIIDRNKRIFGYELIFNRLEPADAASENGVQKQVTADSPNGVAIGTISGNCPALISVDPATAMQLWAKVSPGEQTILQLPAREREDRELPGLCKTLRTQGYSLCMEQRADHSDPPLPNTVNFVKIGVGHCTRPDMEKAVAELKRTSVKIIGTQVATAQDFDDLALMGFDLFQGDFFATPSVIAKKSITPAQALLLELSTRMAKNEDIQGIENIFKKNPDLTFGLLNLAHSAFFSVPESVTSIRQAIALLGYANLQKWVGLMLFNINHSDAASSPLLEKALIRARTMELLARKHKEDGALADSAFITGIFSLIHVLFNVPVEELLGKTTFSGEIRDALRGRAGILGNLLQATETLEKGEYDKAAAATQEMGLSLFDLLSGETQAITEYASSNSGGPSSREASAVETTAKRASTPPILGGRQGKSVLSKGRPSILARFFSIFRRPSPARR